MSVTSPSMITVLVAEDEDFMRERLLAQLSKLWPQANIVAVAENGNDAWDMWLEHEPDVVFLDIQMPGMNGLAVAERIRCRSHIVFVTAFDQHAIQAFEQAAVDYLLKPVELTRLGIAIDRLQQRMERARTQGPNDGTNQMDRKGLASAQAAIQASHQETKTAPLRWLKASVGKQIRLIHLQDVLFLQSDTKYTRVVTKDGEAYLRTPLKDLLEQLDPEIFWQIHRGTIVNAHAIQAAERIDTERWQVSIKSSNEKLNVSRSFSYLFRESQ